MNERQSAALREHLEAALAASDGGESAYHIRAALQYLVTTGTAHSDRETATD